MQSGRDEKVGVMVFLKCLSCLWRQLHVRMFFSSLSLVPMLASSDCLLGPFTPTRLISSVLQLHGRDSFLPPTLEEWVKRSGGGLGTTGCGYQYATFLS